MEALVSSRNTKIGNITVVRIIDDMIMIRTTAINKEEMRFSEQSLALTKEGARALKKCLEDVGL